MPENFEFTYEAALARARAAAGQDPIAVEEEESFLPDYNDIIKRNKQRFGDKPQVVTTKPVKKESTWSDVYDKGRRALGIISEEPKHDNWNTYTDEYKNFHEKTKNRIKESGLETREMRDNNIPRSFINNATDYALFMMNHQDDPAKEAFRNISDKGQGLRSRIHNMNARDHNQDNVTAIANNLMENQELTNDELMVINKAVNGDPIAKNNLVWMLEGKKDPFQSMLDSGGIQPGAKSVITMAQEHYAEGGDRDGLRKLFQEEDRKREHIEKSLERKEFIESGGTSNTKYTEWNDDGTVRKTLNRFKRGIHNANDFTANTFNAIPTFIRAIRADLLMGEENFNSLERTFKELSDMSKVGVRSMLPAAPDRDYQNPENFFDFLTSPDHLSKTVLEQGPMMLQMVAGALNLPKLWSYVMAAGYTGNIKDDMLNYEMETGDKIPYWKRDLAAAAVGPMVGAIDKMSLNMVIGKTQGVAVTKALSKKFDDTIKNQIINRALRTMGVGGLEANTEMMQEVSELLVAAGYRPIAQEEWDNIKLAGYAGFIMGTGANIIFNPATPTNSIQVKGVDELIASKVKYFTHGDDGTGQFITYNKNGDVIAESEIYEDTDIGYHDYLIEKDRVKRLNKTDEVDYDSEVEEVSYESDQEHIENEVLNVKTQEIAEKNDIDVKPKKRRHERRTKKGSLAYAKENLNNANILVRELEKKLIDAQAKNDPKQIEILSDLQDAKAFQIHAENAVSIRESQKKPRLSRKEKKKRALEGKLEPQISEEVDEIIETEPEVDEVVETVEETEPVVADEVVEAEPEVEEVVEETPTDIKSQDLDTRVNTELTEDENYVYTADIRNGKTGNPLSWVKNLNTSSIDGFTKAAKKLQSYVDKYIGSENEQASMNVEEAESAIQSMEEILEGRDLAFDDDFNIIDLQETDTETDAEQAALKDMDKLGFDIIDDGATNMVILPNPVPGMKVVYNGIIKTAQYTYEMLPQKLRQQAETLGITPKNFDATFKSAIDGFKNIPKNIKAWIKKVNKSIKRWWEDNRVQIGEKIERAMAKTGGLRYAVEPGDAPTKQSPTTRLSSIPILKGEEKAPKFKNIEELSRYLTNRSLELQKEMGVDLQVDSDESNEIIAQILAEEIALETGNEWNAGGWYSQKMQDAIRVTKELYPQMEDPMTERAFLFGLAITSNGQGVPSNLKIAYQQFEFYLENGYWNSEFGQISKAEKKAMGVGKQVGAMEQAFALYNELAESWGEATLQDFLETDFTAKELEDAGVNLHGESARIKKIAGELKETIIKGSSIFGPKVGGAFYQNLLGNYDPLTMDLHFSRNINRITGALLPEAVMGDGSSDHLERTGKKDYSKQIKRFRKSIVKNRSLRKKYGITPEVYKDDKALLKVAERMFKDDTNAGFPKDGPPKLDKKTGKYKPARKEHNLAAQRYADVVNKPVEAPKSGAERNRFRKIMKRAVEISGVSSIADAQAILWFPQKRFYGKFGITGESVNETDYKQEAIKIAKQRGLDDTRISGILGTEQQRVTKKSSKQAVKTKKTQKGLTPQQKRAVLKQGRKELYDPGKTSTKQIPAGFKKFAELTGISKGFNLDYGGGAYDLGTQELKKQGLDSVIYDVFARPDDYNKKSMAEVDKRGGADTVTLMNVLNVIKEPESRDFVLKDAYSKLKPGGTMMVSIYYDSQGNSGFRGAKDPAKRTWQEMRAPITYLQEIESSLPDAQIQLNKQGKPVFDSKLFILKKPETSVTPTSIEAGFLGFTPSNLKLLKNTIIDGGLFVYENLPANLQKQGQRIGVTAQNFGRTLSEFSSKTKQNIKAWLKKVQKAMKRWWDDNKVQIGEKIERGMAKMGGIKYAVDPTIEGYQTQLNKLDKKFGKGKGAKKERAKLQSRIENVDKQAEIQGIEPEEVKKKSTYTPPGNLEHYESYSDPKIKKEATAKDRGVISGLWEGFKDLAMVNSFRAQAVNSKIFRLIRGYSYDYMTNASIDRKNSESWLTTINPKSKTNPFGIITKKQKEQLNGILINRDAVALDLLSDKIGEFTIKVTDKSGKKKKITTTLIKEHAKVQKVYDNILKRANEVGLDMGVIEADEGEGLLGYYSRVVKDPVRFREMVRDMEGKEADGFIEKSIEEYILNEEKKKWAKKKARKQKTKPSIKNLTKEDMRQIKAGLNAIVSEEYSAVEGGTEVTVMDMKKSKLRSSEMAKIISGAVFTFDRTSTIAKGTKKRTVEGVDNKLVHQYDDASNALLHYIDSMNKAIARKRLLENHYESGYVNIDDDSDNINIGISSLVENTLAGELNPDEQRESINILSSVLDVKQTGKNIGRLRALGYFTTLNDIGNTLTQLADIGSAIFVQSAQNPLSVVKNFSKAVTNRSDIKMRDLAIDEIMHELSDPSRMMKMVNTQFKMIGFKKFDAMMKETIVNTYIDSLGKQLKKYNKLSRRKQLDLMDKITSVFPEGTPNYKKVIKDLKAGEITPEVLEVGFNGLLDYQPIGDTELPKGYNQSDGLMRLAYQLKTFTLRLANRIVAEGYLNHKKSIKAKAAGNIKDARAYRMMSLTKPLRLMAILMLAGAGKDEIKDLYTGRLHDFDDNLLENFLGLFFMSRYSMDKLGSRGAISEMLSVGVPAAGFADDVKEDLTLIYKYFSEDGLSERESLKYGLKYKKHIPWVGDAIYYRTGRGRKMYLNKSVQRLKEKAREGTLTYGEERLLRSLSNEKQKIKIYEYRN